MPHHTTARCNPLFSRIFLVLTLFFCLLVSSTVTAQESSGERAVATSPASERIAKLEQARGLDRPTPRDRQPPESYGKLLLKMVFGMLAIILLAYVSIRFGLKRFLPDSSGQGKMRVLLRQPIEPKRSLLVVQVASRHMLLASSEQGIQFLTELTEEDSSQLFDTSQETTKKEIPREFTVELDDPLS